MGVCVCKKKNGTCSMFHPCFLNVDHPSLTQYSKFQILQMCTYNWLVDNAKPIIKMTRKVMGQRLFKATMRATIYGQFVAGEDKHDIQGQHGFIPDLLSHAPSVSTWFAIKDCRLRLI